jgi:ADP-dependent NAD(P)H-hydrate dehydratase / NAD(P)H-hydrate epimerase
MKSLRSSLPELYSAAQCRELDRLAIETHGIPGFELMLRAGRTAFHELLRCWPEARHVAVCCGKGNNAGDGYIVAGLAVQSGLRVTLWQLGSARDLAGDAGRARDWARERGVEPCSGPPERIEADVVVDALLGIGFRGEVRDAFAACVAAINASGAPVLAIDIPTGVDADTGATRGPAVRARVTVTFIGRKLGLHTGAGAAHAGAVVFADLGVPGVVHRVIRGVPWLDYGGLPASFRLGPRDATAYKHSLGHVVVVGGDHSMGGAPLMAAEAALRVGAGMVSVVTRAAHRPAILTRRPEIMVVDADDPTACATALARASCLVVGPGLGQHDWGLDLLRRALARNLPTVLDADGINNYATLDGGADRQWPGRPPLIVTPHAAEAARLLGIDVAAVQDDRPAAARLLACRVGGVAVVKGAGSVIASARDSAAELVGVCAHGNPGMASAGMGDVLSGIIGGLLAQGLAPEAATAAGVCLHSLAADRAAAVFGQRSLLATDLLQSMIQILADEEARWD